MRNSIHFKILTELTAIIIIICMAACQNDTPADEGHHETNSMYYWKTVFQPDSADLDFIKQHNIGRIYMRMFDVVKESDVSSPKYATYPNATIRIDYPQYRLLKDSLYEIEIVPVVYITLDALKAMKDNEGILADNIVTRVRNMVQYNELPNVCEIQLDCDWTASTEESFFQLCDSIKSSMTRLELPWLLSSTIRLHQLSREVPPVDRGVLMVYNTGSFDNPDTRNSIIDIADVEPYLRRLSSYGLHLDVAYPAYSWQLLFRNRKFIGLTNGVELSDTNRFKQRNENEFIALRDIPHNGRMIRSGDMIRLEVSKFKDIETVKKSIEQRLSGKRHSNIIYHLDSNNLSNYTYDEIQSIFSLSD